MFKRLIFLTIVTAIFVAASYEPITDMSAKESASLSFNDLSENFSWANEAVYALVKKGAISGIEENVFSPKAQVSREQLAKMLVVALDIKHETSAAQTFIDVPSVRWSFNYIEAVKDIFPKRADSAINEFLPEQSVTREELAAIVVNALNLPINSDSSLLSEYADFKDTAPDLSAHLITAVTNNIISGSDNLLRPKSTVNRAEASVIIYRAMNIKNGRPAQNSGKTNIEGESTVTLEQAKAWAQSKDAHERFINIADIYWKYGEKTGIRPEVLYAQAAKETNYGKYTGNVVPEQNNWAGIKTKSASGDKTEDHESFATADDGVRAHFNHMAAYLGANTSGQTHDRYEVVMTAAWAGSIKYVEELGGHWAPALSYGYDIVEKYLEPMEMTTT
ncbi:MAG: S-layer homology domain-containing protein [Clostridia bacterium]|nr:S-layer homology domain-containing protein [Clostridia bacterium]